jgi:hypothetical protein
VTETGRKQREKGERAETEFGRETKKKRTDLEGKGDKFRDEKRRERAKETDRRNEETDRSKKESDRSKGDGQEQ